ncbi:MAG: hypothetical protein PVG89_04505 [Gammaproteobacteria bacterium]|jgi:hypothetical protein
MKLKTIVTAVALALGTAGTAYAVDTSDVEDISMQAVDSAVELPDAAMRELTLPETASEKAVERAQNREGYGLSRANEVRGAMPDMPGDGDSGDDMGGDMDMGDDVGDDMDDATDMAEDAAEDAEETVADATDDAEEAVNNAKNAAANAAERASDRRPGV